jgi:hypothetical protein
MPVFSAFLDCLKDQLGTISAPQQKSWADHLPTLSRLYVATIYQAISDA